MNSAQSKENEILIVSGQPLIPQVSDAKATAVFLEISSLVSNHLQAQLKSSKIQSNSYVEKTKGKSASETVSNLLKSEKYKAVVFVSVKYLNMNGSDVVAVNLHCNKLLYTRTESKLESNVEGVFDIMSKPERSMESVAKDFSRLLLRSTCIR